MQAPTVPYWPEDSETAAFRRNHQSYTHMSSGQFFWYGRLKKVGKWGPGTIYAGVPSTGFGVGG